MPFWTVRRVFKTAVFAFVVLLIGWAAVVLAVAVEGARDQATTADAIVVLGAAQYNGRPSPVFRSRLDHAATLYQRGYAPVVLVTGGVGTGDTVSESEVGRRYLVRVGLPEGAVTALPAGASTSSSLDGVARWFTGQSNRRVLLVSDGFHMLRLQIIASRLGLVPFTSPTPNSRLHAGYLLSEGVKVPLTWLFQHGRGIPCSSPAAACTRARSCTSTWTPSAS